MVIRNFKTGYKTGYEIEVQLINPSKEAVPGHLFRFNVETVADEMKVWETREWIAKRGHHTAIVRSKPDVNGMMKTYEQHVNGRDVVQKMRLYLRSVSPTVTHSVGVYPHLRTKKKERVNITTTITIEVTGKIWPYRPKSK